MICTLIFDIGKTNKKYFLFDENYKVIEQEARQFEELKDEDGFPCDDLNRISAWVKDCIRQIIIDKKYPVKTINFTTYGASFVHLDQAGKPLTPLYNYLKPIPDAIVKSFHAKYGDPLIFAGQTASPSLGMLNSGLQLYWLKYTQPEIFNKIRWSLHFPQYLSFLITGIPLSEYTSIGCHTGLWDFEKKDYHQWVYAEKIDRILAPVVPASVSINKKIGKIPVKIGVGIHDSSAALVPYRKAESHPFLLLSTGTWSIGLNSFDATFLTKEDLEQDCLLYMTPAGEPVRAARLFLGREYQVQIEAMHGFFNCDDKAHQQVAVNEKLYEQLQKNYERYFSFKAIQLERTQPDHSSLKSFRQFEDAYHQLMLELVEYQIQVIQRAEGKRSLEKIYIDGGFVDNTHFVYLLTRHFYQKKWRTTRSSIGTALGAALVISDKKLPENFLETHFKRKSIR